jgi:hypothetical protein
VLEIVQVGVFKLGFQVGVVFNWVFKLGCCFNFVVAMVMMEVPSPPRYGEITRERPVL